MRHLSRLPAAQLRSVCLRYWRLGPAQALIHDASGGQSCILSSHTSFPFSAHNSGAGESENDNPLIRLEAVLFLAREPLTSRKIAQFAALEDGTQARTLIQRLNARYDEAGRAFRVEEIAGGYQLLTRRKFSGWLRRLAHVPGEARLSPPALETLAVIAYRQPVLKADIEAIRGVHCGEILRQLMERDLVRISGRSDELGRPFLYATTRRFLNLFGLHSLEDLPRAAAICSAPVVPGPPLALIVDHAAEGPSPSGEESPREYTVEDDGAAEIELGDLEAGSRP